MRSTSVSRGGTSRFDAIAVVTFSNWRYGGLYEAEIGHRVGQWPELELHSLD